MVEPVCCDSEHSVGRLPMVEFGVDIWMTWSDSIRVWSDIILMCDGIHMLYKCI